MRLILVFSSLLLLTACAGEFERTSTPAAGLPDESAWRMLRRGLASFSAGDYPASQASFDKVLEAASPGDSQLVFLGVYYGVRTRLMDGRQASADSLYDNWRRSLPGGQTDEVELVLGRIRLQPGLAELAGKEPKARTIGVILPLSGQFSEFGQAILEGIKLAVEKYNDDRPPENQAGLRVVDDVSDQIKAASLGRELASDSSIVALIGSYSDETSMAISLVASAQGIPLVCPTASAPGLDHLGPMVHIINRTDPHLAATLAEFAVDKLGFQTFAVLAPDDEYGMLLTDTFADALRQRGAALVSLQRYGEEITNFENPMNLLRRYLPDAVYLPVHSSEITQVAAQVYYYGLDQVNLLGTELWNNERVIRMGGEYVDGAIFAAPFFQESADLRWSEFKDSYESTYRRPVNRFSALGFDSAELILEAASELPAGRRLLAEKLNSTERHQGAMGVYTVEPNGLIKRDAFMLQISGGTIVPAQIPEVPQDSLEDPQPLESPAGPPPSPGP
ncbi:MAG: ABC transporter substrate-binding protein [Candidatus Glassbacteria bacterium]|nr:ABC transporter substrate-binding protein [Candidatus Glassbacteria bacterium]